MRAADGAVHAPTGTTTPQPCMGSTVVWEASVGSGPQQRAWSVTRSLWGSARQRSRSGARAWAWA